MNSSKVLLGVLGGVAAGAIAGILFAPAKGKKTRKRILNKGKGFADDMKDKFEELYENVTDKYETLLQSNENLIAEEKTKLNSIKKEIKSNEH
ncbi:MULTISPECIES: YtxH domain-containing protein [unclassified Flavobacterium]|uniref:YtxH domain-containing protein n=1 Tax=unclassified Flavobacterium TaxID=196869 RepID=UPI0025BB65DB|nr:MULTISPECIES: YtxH domain-containing protein [unclassified Flavobacterium]